MIFDTLTANKPSKVLLDRWKKGNRTVEELHGHLNAIGNSEAMEVLERYIENIKTITSSISAVHDENLFKKPNDNYILSRGSSSKRMREDSGQLPRFEIIMNNLPFGALKNFCNGYI